MLPALPAVDRCTMAVDLAPTSRSARSAQEGEDVAQVELTQDIEQVDRRGECPDSAWMMDAYEPGRPSGHRRAALVDQDDERASRSPCPKGP